jgi:uncharacterized membrane protein
MNIIVVLTLILFILMKEIGGNRGVRSFVALLLNFCMLFFTIFLISRNYSPLLITLVSGITISCITLFFINKVNEKTVAAFISILLTLLLLVVFIYLIGSVSKIQGFGEEEYDELSSYNLFINLDFTKIVVCTMIMGLIGAVIDSAISISSAMNEVYLNNPSLTRLKLFESGMNIGKDILGTTTNTLYFAFVGGYLALLLWFKDLSYSMGEILNSKVFAAEILQILCSGFGATLIIPITAGVSAYMLVKKRIEVL